MIKKTGKVLWGGLKATVRATAGATSAGKGFLVANKDRLAGTTRGAVRIVGGVALLAGRSVAGASAAVAGAAHGKAGSSSNVGVKGAGHAVGYLADGISVVGKGAQLLGLGVWTSAPAVGSAAAGALTGGAAMVSESLDAVGITDHEIQGLRNEVLAAGRRMRVDSLELAVLKNREGRWRARRELLDRLVVGGVTLAAAIRDPSKVPAEVEAAFASAYPGLAANETFIQAAARLEPNQLVGLVSGVKGKLFEMKLVDFLNAEGLPAGYTASLASSASQPGWDIQVTDATGNVVELLQAKATESVGYVRQALERYPGIEVTTTSEVYAQLSAIGAAEGVRDSGMALMAVESLVRDAADAGPNSLAGELAPYAAGLAVVALSVFLDRSISADQRADALGDRGARFGIASLAGHGVLLATQSWWLALAGAVGSHWLTGRGRSKRAELEGLNAVLASLKRLDAARMGRQQPAGA